MDGVSHGKTLTSTSPPSHDELNISADSPISTAEKDVAIELVGEQAREIDPAIEKKVLRKIDWFLIPAMIVGTNIISPFSHNLLPIYNQKLTLRIRIRVGLL